MRRGGGGGGTWCPKLGGLQPVGEVSRSMSMAAPSGKAAAISTPAAAAAGTGMALLLHRSRLAGKAAAVEWRRGCSRACCAS